MPVAAFSPAVLAAGEALYSCVRLDWPEPHRGASGERLRRFSPIHDGPRLARVLYAGDTPGCALGETVFRDLLGGQALHPARLEGRAMMRIRCLQDLTLADLRTVAAKARGSDGGSYREDWGGAPGAWGASRYESSRHLAQQVYDDGRAPTPSGTWDGIVWDSHQEPSRPAYLVLTGRVTGALEPGRVEPLTDPGWRDVVGRYAGRLRVILPLGW